VTITSLMNEHGAGRLTVYLGPLATMIYVLFTVLAWLAYPAAYGPFNNNWLSDLGDRTLNPNGADFYVVGCIATGLLVGAAFVGLLAWRQTSTRIQRYLLAFVQIAGLLGALAIVMTAVYTIDQFEAHQFWSRGINVGFAVALFVSPFALRRSGVKLWPLIAVSAFGYCSIVARLVFPDAHWLEWPSIGFLLIYMWVIALMTRAEISSEMLSTTRPNLAKIA
jgi:hypothetical protein